MRVFNKLNSETEKLSIQATLAGGKINFQSNNGTGAGSALHFTQSSSDKKANAWVLIDGTWHATIMRHFNRLALDCRQKLTRRINARYKWRPIKVNKLLLWQAVSCLAVWSGSINSSREENRTEKKLYPTRVFAQQLSTEHRHQQQKKHKSDFNLQNFSATYHTEFQLLFTDMSETFFRKVTNLMMSDMATIKALDRKGRHERQQ